MDTPQRNPWILPVLAALVAIGLFFGVVFTRAGVDLQELLGTWLVNAVLFVVFAVAALLVYRALRRARAPAVMDEARSSRTGR